MQSKVAYSFAANCLHRSCSLRWHIHLQPTAYIDHGKLPAVPGVRSGSLWAGLLHSVVFCAGRHMLTEMVVDNYIPNDTHMTEDEGRVQVLA